MRRSQESIERKRKAQRIYAKSASGRATQDRFRLSPKYQRSREKRKDEHLRLSYGITLEHARGLLEGQGWKCGACERPLSLDGREAHIDHDHASGAIRGILCQTCNSGIGALGDTVEGLERAIRYLRKGRA